ncbi:MAG: hypothetical protein JW751_16150 [Polyangiaceae bacterium]|nr:hypothetical protein [Polyangiaceae bacterium]
MARPIERAPGTVFDDLSVGRREVLTPNLASGAVAFEVADLLDLGWLERAMAGHDVVFPAGGPRAPH